MDFNAWVATVIESVLNDLSITTKNINPGEVIFQIQPVAHLEHAPRDTTARFYPSSHHCLSVVFWHPSPHPDRVVPIACFPCLMDEGLLPSAASIVRMTREAVQSIDGEYGNRLAVLEQSAEANR